VSCGKSKTRFVMFCRMSMRPGRIVWNMRLWKMVLT
jgi:hypothetical protein